LCGLKEAHASFAAVAGEVDGVVLLVVVDVWPRGIREIIQTWY
jgi:hypothetical protein